MNWLLRKIILFSFWGAITFTALLAILSVSVGKLIPYLDNYRPQIESNLQQITGYPVKLSNIDGRLEGIDPTVSVSGFQLFVNDKSVITIDEIRVRLDVIKSILSLSPQFTYIRFLRPIVSLQEVEGLWRLNEGKAANGDVGIERVLDYLSAQRNFSILNAEINAHSDQFGKHIVRVPYVYIFQKEFGSLLSSTFYLDDYESPFKVDARLDQTIRLLGNYRIKAAIQSPLISLPLKVFKTNSLSSVEVGGDIWLDFVVDKELKLRAESTHFNVSFSDSQQYEITSSIKLNYSLSRPSLRIDIDNLQVKDQAGKNYLPTDVVFDWSSVSNRSSISFDQMDLDLGHQLGSYFLPAESSAQAILNGLSPIGTAKNGSINFSHENDELSFQYLSNLQTASINAYKGIPKATNINAIFSLSKSAGYIDFEGTKSDIHFDVAYDDVWATDFLSGHVSWSDQQGTLLLSGRDLLVQRNDADLDGGFRVEVRDNAPDWISLDLHGRNISASDRLTYIPPNALNDDLKTWIDASISEAGQADDVNVLVQGELIDNAQPHVRVRVEASDLEITFDENWPTAKRVSGMFEFDKMGVSVQIDSAYLSDLPVTNIKLSVPINNGSADWLNVKGVVADDSSTILSMLENTPLIDSVLQPFSSWELEGDIEGRFDISVPFSKGVDPKIELGLVFKDNHLLIKDLNLPSTIKNGRLNYSSNLGITDSIFDIQGLGGPSRLVLSSNITPNGRLAVTGSLSGTTDIRRIAEWQKVPKAVINKISGETSYQGELSVNQTQNGQVDLTIDSYLIGVNIDLPEPVGKSAQEAKLLRVKLMQHEGDIVVDADYNRLSDVRFLLHDGEFIGGEVNFNRNSGKPFDSAIPRGLVVSGDFNLFDVQEWFSTLNDLPDESGGSSNNIEMPSIPKWLTRVDLIVDEVVVNPDNVWHNFKVSYNSVKDNSLFVSSDEVNFSFRKKNNLPDLHFDFLSWNTASTAVDNRSDSQSEAPISAQQIPNMMLSVNQFYLNEQPYGDWQLKISRENNLVRVDPISSELMSGRFIGSLYWLDAGDDSTVNFKVAVSGEDLSELTEKFSSEAFLSSKKYNIDVDLTWKGHPFYFNRQTVLGGIKFSAENGVFHKVDELPAFLKVLGIFNVGALTRRLTLDFSDIYTSGLTYDEFTGALTLKDGILRTTKPIKIDSPSANILLEGKANIVNETLDEKLTAIFPLTGALPLAGLLWGTPQLAGLLFITDMLIGDELSKVTSIEYKIEGAFDNPTMTPMKHK
jgi:uncharacterized protein (TIGR02099 family)